VLVTRAVEQAGAFVMQLQELGARVVECPTIQLAPPEQWGAVDDALRQLPGFDWLILTSANGVRFLFERLAALGIAKAALRSCKVCVVGPKTAEALGQRGLVADLIPEQFTAEGVVAAFAGIDLQGKRVLFPKAAGARDVIPRLLAEQGAVVVDPVLYRTLLPEQLPEAARSALEERELDLAIFSAPSTVQNLATLVGGADRLVQLLLGVAVASIGPITSRACRELGLAVAVEPCHATLPDLLDTLEQYVSR
jgi:uroporphyrinogen-III synthase